MPMSIDLLLALIEVITKGEGYQVQKATVDGIVEAMTGAGFETLAA